MTTASWRIGPLAIGAAALLAFGAASGLVFAGWFAKGADILLVLIESGLALCM